MNICDRDAVRHILAKLEPWAVVNAAGFVRIDAAEHQSARCFRENTAGAVVLMEAAREREIAYATFSSDLVFDGAAREPYVESSRTSALSEYGRSKEAAEKAVLRYRKTLCVRTAAFFGCWERGDFLSAAMSTLAGGRPFRAAVDVIISPTYLPDLAGACLDLLIDEQSGIFHLANQGAVSWAELVILAAGALNVDCNALQARPKSEMSWTAERPPFSALASERAMLMPTLESALRRYAGVASGLLGPSSVSRRDGTFRS